MKLAQRIKAFSILGDKIRNLSNESMAELARKARLENPWFTEENVIRALHGASLMLTEEKLTHWLSTARPEPEVPKITGIVMAGNIPLVGFHDLMTVLLSGHFAAIKTSSQDTCLIKQITEWLLEIEPGFRRNLELRERLTGVDVVIATGSDNTARYFEYYFRNIPSVIRKNRSSVAVLDGKETTEELASLGKDIFWYFGLGCRNVSKILVPENYDPVPFFEAIETFSYVADHHKYRNNYDYYKSIFLVNQTTHLDNGFLLWLPTVDLVSPISVLYVQEYKTSEQVDVLLETNAEKIQCIVGKNYIPFGQAQFPEPWDYADRMDTLAFLQGL